MTPKVSFVVPCYKLAHFLPECVNSILAQTYKDFEVLIMDDASPDNTPEVAASFKDPRVKHIRNNPNLGHLRNYNKGIGLAQGEFIWLISADDVIRRPEALERYVIFMQQHPRVGYVFSSGVGLVDGKETGLLESYSWGHYDLIFEGRKFISRVLLRGGGILAPSCMARKDCYKTVSLFPLDLPHQADVYLWCVWALYYDVAYFAEPLVSYRLHDESIMSQFKRTDRWILIRDQLVTQWRVKQKAIEAGQERAIRTWVSSVASLCSYSLLSDRFGISPSRMTFDQFEEFLHSHAYDAWEERRVRARVFAGYADGCYKHGQLAEALQFYRRALRQDTILPKVWVKYALLCMGRFGVFSREIIRSVRDSKMTPRVRNPSS